MQLNSKNNYTRLKREHFHPPFKDFLSWGLLPFFKWVSVVGHLKIRLRSSEGDDVSILYYSMNIPSGWKADWKSDQPVKGTEYRLSRITDEEKSR